MDILSKLDKKDILELTVQQKESIEKEGKIIVSASAGSGKTSTMIKKIVALVSSGKHLRDMLIVVYNDAAAAELKQKLYNKLLERIKDPFIDDETRNVLIMELNDMDFCQISTIHAFCMKLAKENFETLKISPQFEILDAQREEKLKNKAIDNVLENYSKKSNDEVFNNLLIIFSKGRKDENLKNNLLQLYQTYNIQSDKDKFKKQKEKCFGDSFEENFMQSYVYEYYKEIISKCLDISEDVKDAIKDSGMEGYIAKNEYNVDTLAVLQKANNLIELCNIAKNIGSYDGKGIKPKNGYDKYCKLVRLVNANLNSVLSELKKVAEDFDVFKKGYEQNKVYVDKIIELVEAFAVEYKELKDNENKYTFDDLLNFACYLIEHKEGGLDKFEYVFVDEYQDVTPLTHYITSYFMDKNSFIVGDVKQSIYGFNLADPTLFIERQKEYASNDGISISFNRNFRSRKNVLSFVNDVFSKIMTLKSADIDYEKDSKFELDGVREGGIVETHIFTNKEAKVVKPISEIYDIKEDINDENEEVSKSVVEGKWIANKIKLLVGQEHLLDKVNDTFKTIDYSDIVVLFRERSGAAQKIVEILKEENIPVDDSSFTLSVSNPEKELMSFLRVIDNPRQDIWLAGYLLSYFGGYTEDELATIACSVKGQTFYDKLMVMSNVEGPLQNKILKTLKDIDEYRLKASFKNVTDLMNGIVSDFSYDAYLTRNGISEVNSLKSFIISKIVRKGCSLSEFINDYSTKEKNKSFAGSSNAVKISTFHGYKGLESPVVFVSDISKSYNNKDVNKELLFDGYGNIGLQYYDLDNTKKYNSLSYLCLKKLLKSKQIKEEMRLLYVALTRAKERMYITGTSSSDPDKVLPKLLDANSNLDLLRQAEYLLNGEFIDFEEYDYERGNKEDINYDNIVDDELKQIISDSQNYEYPYETSTKLGMKYGVSSILSDDEEFEYAFEESNVLKEKSIIGTCYHKVMQYIDLESKTLDDIDKEYNRFVSEGLITIEELNKVDKSDILRCLSTDFIKKAIEVDKNLKLKREEKFVMYIEANKVSDEEKFQTNDKILVQGIIDMFVDGEEKILVDFKTSSLMDPLTVSRYEKQLNLYRIAIESKLDTKIDRMILYSFTSGKIREVKAN